MQNSKINQAERILQDAEKIRAVDQVTSKVEVVTTTGKPNADQLAKPDYRLSVLQGSERRSYIEFTYPDEEVNRRMLAIGTRYWSKFSGAKNRVIPIFRREAIGNSAFAMADVFQMDTKDDYNVKIIGEEKQGEDLCVKLQLGCKRKQRSLLPHRLFRA